MPLSRNVCPAECDGCREELTKPYLLPCQHYIGQCCKERIDLVAGDDRQCPADLCEIILPGDYEWIVNVPALKNR